MGDGYKPQIPGDTRLPPTLGRPLVPPPNRLHQGPTEPRARRPKTSVMAVVALVLTIVGVFALPIALSLIGVILAGYALRDIERSNGWITGRELTVAAMWVGGVGIAIWVAVITFIVGLMPALIVVGAVGVEEPCSQSEWYAQTRSQVDSLVPGTTKTARIDTPECWTNGGKFSLSASTTHAAAGFQDDVEVAARANGWRGYGLDSGCMVKSIAGHDTYLSGRPDPHQPGDFLMYVSSDSVDYCEDEL